MRAHGSVACGPTLQTAVFRAVYTEVMQGSSTGPSHLRHEQAVRQAALDAEEGRLMDGINQMTGMRAWELWRSQIRAQVNW